MNKRLFRTIGLAVILWGAAIAAVNTKGTASCVPQVGFSALMQKALFASSSTCAVTPHGACTSAGSICTINSQLSPGNGTQGKCTTSSIAGCACVPCQTQPCPAPSVQP